MGSLFSKKKNRVTQHDKAVLDLKVQRDKLKQYQKQCDAVLARETEIARKLLKEGKKDKALRALKKKKYQEQLLSKTEAQMNNIQEMIDSIEFAQLEQKVFEGLKQGNEVLKQIQSQMKIEDIENLMLDTQEAVAYQNEIDQLISGVFTQEDDEEIMKELEELEQQVPETTLKESDLPSVPKEAPQAQPTKAASKASQEKEAVLA
jgi:charged multivesicular body protein 6